MELSLIRRLIEDDDPLQALYEALTGVIWTPERLDGARRREDLSLYLREGERAASELERHLYAIYGELYTLLESEDPRRDRVKELHAQPEYTLLLIDALSLREVPLVTEIAAGRGFSVQPGFALAAPPTETTNFTRRHYSTAGPSAMVGARRNLFAFRRVTREHWQPDFASHDRQRFIWYVFPDDYFGLHDADYTRHVVHPVEAILKVVLDDPTLVRPLVITSDHGYLWQGDQCAWPLEPAESGVMAEAFGLGRSTHTISDTLAATGKVWLGDIIAAARGRFGWGGMVPGGAKLYRHGGVSLMECLTPWSVIL